MRVAKLGVALVVAGVIGTGVGCSSKDDGGGGAVFAPAGTCLTYDIGSPIGPAGNGTNRVDCSDERAAFRVVWNKEIQGDQYPGNMSEIVTECKLRSVPTGNWYRSAVPIEPSPQAFSGETGRTVRSVLCADPIPSFDPVRATSTTTTSSTTTTTLPPTTTTFPTAAPATITGVNVGNETKVEVRFAGDVVLPSGGHELRFALTNVSSSASPMLDAHVVGVLLPCTGVQAEGDAKDYATPPGTCFQRIDVGGGAQQAWIADEATGSDTGAGSDFNNGILQPGETRYVRISYGTEGPPAGYRPFVFNHGSYQGKDYVKYVVPLPVS